MIKSFTDRGRIPSGALAGYCVWCIYGLIELAVLELPAWANTPRHLLQPLHPGITAFLFIAYGFVGALMGAVLAVFLPLEKVKRMSVCLVLFALMLTHRGVAQIDQLNSVLVVANLSIVTIGACWSLFGAAPTSVIGLLSTPWTAFLLALIPGRVLYQLTAPQPWEAFTVMVACGAAILIATSLILRRGNWKTLSLRYALTLSALALVFTGVEAAYLPSVLKASRVPATISPKTPNIILIVLDTVRADHMSLYGYKRDTTPWLREFAKESLVFANAYSAADFTLPSHASMFTGLYAGRHGAHRNNNDWVGTPIPSKAATLAQLLANAGYSTSAVVSNYFFLAPNFGFDRGFDYYDARPGYSIERTKRTLPTLRGSIGARLRQNLRFRSLAMDFRPAEQITAEALDRVDELSKSDRPFFLFLNYMDAHRPRIPPVPYQDLFPGRDVNRDPNRYASLYRQVIFRRQPLSEFDRVHMVSQYDGSVAFLDSQLQTLIHRLRQSGTLDHTLLIITSDHGETIGEHMLIDHSVSVYQEQVRVPLLIRSPAGGPRGSSSIPVSGVDIMPTILRAAGLDAPAGIDGSDILNADAPSSRLAFAESFPQPSTRKPNPFDRLERAAMSDRWKLIVSTRGKRELYDLQADPREMTNVADSRPDIVAKMEPELAKLAHSIKSAQPAQIADEETLRKLHSLGYAGK